jgi:hypothetical protein
MQWCTISTADTTVKVWFDFLSQLAVSLGGGSLGCTDHPGNLYPLTEAVWVGDRSRKGFRIMVKSSLFILLAAILILWWLGIYGITF